MGLRLIAALLPHDYREQVLGDLTEGGYRWQDALSMLPRIWWSHLRRSVAGPVPNYSENEDTIRVRIEQLRSARM